MADREVERFGVFEEVFHSSGAYSNPYREVEAVACFHRPDGDIWQIPLFYDGANVWKVRVSPDTTGLWRYSVRSSDPGLDGQTGELQCVASALRGGLVSMPGFPYHFAYQNGTPMWLMGDTQWRAMANDAEKRVDRSSICRYVDVRAGQGFNYIHTDVMGGGGIDSRQPVFASFPEERINPEFFQEVDFRVRYMNQQGICAGLVLAWHRGPVAWEAFPSADACLRYARYMVARYSAYNVVLIVSGEWDQIHRWRKPLFQSIGREIMRNDPHHRMRAIHPCQRRSVEEFATEPWMSFGDYQQTYEATHRREALPAERRALHYALLRTRRHGKPVVNSEYAYFLREMAGHQDYHPELVGVDKPHSHTRDSFRRAGWALAMAGGYFVTGFGTTYFGGWRDAGPFDVDAAKNDDAESDLANLKSFFTSLQWWKLQPAGMLVSCNEPGYAYCLADIGDTYVVYCEGASRLTLDTDTQVPVEYTVQRFDPRHASWEPVAGGEASGRIRLPVPDAQDWAFVVRMPR